MTTKQTLENEVIFLIRDLIKVYDQKGMRASGNWARNLEGVVTTSESKLQAKILGLDYSEQLEYGRKPNNVEKGSKKEKSLIAFLAYGKIAQWVKDKNVSITAWLVARKIVREGWDRQGYGGVGIVKDVITPKRIQKIIDVIGEYYIYDFSEMVIKIFKDGINR